MAASNIRSRQVPGQASSSSSSSSEMTSKHLPSKVHQQHSTPSSQSRLSVLDILRILGGLFLLSSTLSYFVTSNSIFWNYRPPFAKLAELKAWIRGPLLLTPSELALYNGTDPNLPIYLALNGSIYDVSASPHLYGPGGNYGFFAGKDATRAFVTGCFEEDLVGDLRGVEEMHMPIDEEEGKSGKEQSKEERRERKLRRERETREARRKVFEVVDGWRKLFDGGKDGKYFWVGKVIGQEWGARRKLCQKAMDKRPKRTAEK